MAKLGVPIFLTGKQYCYSKENFIQTGIYGINYLLGIETSFSINMPIRELEYGSLELTVFCISTGQFPNLIFSDWR